MNLVIDVGNTLVKTAIFDRGNIIEHQVHENLTADIINDVIQGFPHIDACIIGSVRELPDNILGMFPPEIEVLLLKPETDLPISHRYKTLDTLGADRIAGVVAVHALYPGKNVLLIETGTCITYDLISADGIYQGGGISPGLHMRFMALHTFTHKLPLIEPVSNPALLGDSTETSILSGVVNGLKAEVEGIISLYESNYENLTIILSGGNLDYFDKNLKNNIFAVPNIVLTGLNIILEFNDKN
jgi:type III pantothenate kinase